MARVGVHVGSEPTVHRPDRCGCAVVAIPSRCARPAGVRRGLAPGYGRRCCLGDALPCRWHPNFRRHRRHDWRVAWAPSLSVLTFRAVEPEEVTLVAVRCRLLIDKDKLTLLERAEPVIPANLFESAIALLRERDTKHAWTPVVLCSRNGRWPAATLISPGTDDLRAACG